MHDHPILCPRIASNRGPFLVLVPLDLAFPPPTANHGCPGRADALWDVVCGWGGEQEGEEVDGQVHSGRGEKSRRTLFGFFDRRVCLADINFTRIRIGISCKGVILLLC